MRLGASCAGLSKKSIAGLARVIASSSNHASTCSARDISGRLYNPVKIFLTVLPGEQSEPDYEYPVGTLVIPPVVVGEQEISSVAINLLCAD